MTSLLPVLAVVSVVAGATEATISFDALDGGLEVGAPASSDSAVARGLKNDSGNVARVERQKLLFAFADRTAEELAADVKAPVLELVSDGLRNVQVANPRRKRPPVEVQALDLISLLPRMTKEGERKTRVANVALWLERGRGVDETEAALAAISATAELAALKKLRAAHGDPAAADKFASAVEAFASMEGGLRKKLDAWLRARVKAGELPVPRFPTVPGTIVARHFFRITDVTPREDGLYFLSWDQPAGYRRTIERVDAKGARTALAGGVDIARDFQPWRGGWGWVDHRGALRSFGADGEREELSLTKFAVQRFLAGDEVNVLVLEPRREAKGSPDWVLATWVREQPPVVLAHGAGAAQLLGVHEGRAVVRVGSHAHLFDLAGKRPRTRVPLPEGATYWLDGKLVLNANSIVQAAQFLWVDLGTGVTTRFADAPLGIVTQDPNVIRLTAGFRPQQISVLEGAGAAVPLGSWPSVLSVVRAGDDFYVASDDPTLEFGTVSRVARPAP